MTTFGGLTDATVLYLQGFTNLQDAATYLTSSISSSDTTLPVNDPTTMARGLIEIENEMIWVDSVGSTDLTVPPYGRGFRSSTAAAHASGTRVVAAPMFPRFMVQAALNDAIQSIFPMVSAIGTTTFTFNPAVTTYELPAGTQTVISVAWQEIGPSQEWAPVRRWRLDSTAPASAFATGASISLYDSIVPGRTVQVVYMKQPTVLSAEADVFTTVTGLPASCEDVVRMGAAYRMVSFLDSPHLMGNSAEADLYSNVRPVGGAGQLGKQLLQMYRIRLQEEAVKQQSLYPIRAHYTR